MMVWEQTLTLTWVEQDNITIKNIKKTNMERKYTAVNWLINTLEALESNLEKGLISVDDFIIDVKWSKDKAKEIEREQLINAHTRAYLIEEEHISKEFADKVSTEYYNEKYKQD